MFYGSSRVVAGRALCLPRPLALRLIVAINETRELVRGFADSFVVSDARILSRLVSVSYSSHWVSRSNTGSERRSLEHGLAARVDAAQAVSYAVGSPATCPNAVALTHEEEVRWSMERSRACWVLVSALSGAFWSFAFGDTGA